MTALGQRWEELARKEQKLKGSFVRFDKLLQVGADGWGRAGHRAHTERPSRGQGSTKVREWV